MYTRMNEISELTAAFTVDGEEQDEQGDKEGAADDTAGGGADVWTVVVGVSGLSDDCTQRRTLTMHPH